MYSTKRPIIDHKNKGYSAAKVVCYAVNFNKISIYLISHMDMSVPKH
jgi:hypothetical protein